MTSGRQVALPRLRLLLWCVAALVIPDTLVGQNVTKQCGGATVEVPSLEAGRWLPWSTDDGGGTELPSRVTEPIFDRLGAVLDLFQSIPTLRPPMGVELRPSRSIRRVGTGDTRDRIIHSWLLIQVFHPTLEVAGEASASVRVEVNSLTPLLYDAAGPLIEDSTGPIFIEPVLVGEVSGNPLYQTRIRTCVAVLKAHDRQVWLPVSRERLLRAQIAEFRSRAGEADNEVSAALAEQLEADKEMDETICRLRATDPVAADRMEREVAAMRRELERQRPEVVAGMGRMNDTVTGWIARLEAQLAAMSPAERAQPAYVTGAGSVLEILADPADEGARALVAPNPDYFEADQALTRFQLITVRMSSLADHPPETAIVESVRRELDWEVLMGFLGDGPAPQ